METKISINNDGELIAQSGRSEDAIALEKLIYPCGEFGVNTYYVEFVVNNNMNSNDTVRISKDREIYKLQLPKDGWYIYYVISVLDESSVSDDYVDLYYDSTIGKLMFKKKAVTNIADIIPYLSISSGVIEYEDIHVFSLYNFRKCIMKTELNNVHKCNKSSKGCKPEESKSYDNFLFISLYVLETLICQERYSEASDILERLESCGITCDDIKINTQNCGCNG